MIPNPAFWRGKRVLLTGHTGFIGGWTVQWLHRLGAKVWGLALAPGTEPNLFETAGIAGQCASMVGDMRDLDRVRQVADTAQPHIMLHLAAQPLVLRAFADPVETFATNVQGAVHVLDTIRRHDRIEAVVIFTTDKVYLNVEQEAGYREDARLGGYEPYGCSKAAAELVTCAYRHAYFQGERVATLRAGNVIGGGDWAENRLIPDAVRAFQSGRPLVLRRPEAVRPWQHVLESVRGLLLLAERLAERRPETAAGWNIGPSPDGTVTVGEIGAAIARLWGDGAKCQARPTPDAPYEATLLSLDPSKAERIGWRPRLSLEQALELTVGWYKAQRGGANMAAFSARQIASYAKTVTATAA